MTLPARIRDARARLGLSQSEAAARCGVSARTFQGWEAGKHPAGHDPFN